MNSSIKLARPPLSRRGFIRSSIGAGSLLACGTFSNGAPFGGHTETLDWRTRGLIGFGTTIWLRAAHTDGQRAERALDAAVHELRAIEAQMSVFKVDSGLSQLNRHGRLVNPDPRLVELIGFANRVSQRSEGAFDISVQPLWTVWQSATRQHRLPSQVELEQARAHVGWQGIRVESHEIRLKPGMSLTLNGIAQGYAADRVRAVLASHGIEHALLDTGEWSALSPDFSAAGWRLGIANPLVEEQLIATLAADGRSIATSSDQHSHFSADRRHHHIFDPHTGYSPTSLASVTVLAASCALADALTKVFFMAERVQSGSAVTRLAPTGLATPAARNPLIQRARELTQHWQVDVLLVDKQGRWWASDQLPLVARS
jgi:FAD:protein FMN transferase